LARAPDECDFHDGEKKNHHKLELNCRQYFDVKLPSTHWSDHVRRFDKKFAGCDNIFVVKVQSQFDSLYLSLS